MTTDVVFTIIDDWGCQLYKVTYFVLARNIKQANNKKVLFVLRESFLKIFCFLKFMCIFSPFFSNKFHFKNWKTESDWMYLVREQSTNNLYLLSIAFMWDGLLPYIASFLFTLVSIVTVNFLPLSALYLQSSIIPSLDPLLHARQLHM